MQADKDNQFVQNDSFRHLFIGCEITSNPLILAELRSQFGLDYPNLLKRYPFDFYLEVLQWLRPQLYPDDNEVVGYEKIGRGITRGFWPGAVGQVLKSNMAVMGFQKGISFLLRIITSNLSFGRFEMKEERLGYIRFIWWDVPGPSDITRGIFLEVMETAGVKQGTISYYNLTALDTEFEINWSE